VIDLQDTRYGWRRAPLPVGPELIKEIRGSQYRRTISRVVVELGEPATFAITPSSSGLTVALDASIGGPDMSPARPSTRARPAAPAVPPPGVARPAVPVDGATARPAGAGKAAAPKREVARADAVATSPAVIAQAPEPGPAAPADGARLISLDFKDADVVNLLRILAAESGKNIIIGDDVKGKMSITLRNVPWHVALGVILEARGLQKIERDNMIRIVSTEQLMRERDAASRLEEAKHKAEADIRQKIADAKKAEQAVAAAEIAQQEAVARGPLREETIRLSYANPVDVAATLQGILGIPPQGAQASPLTPYGPPPIIEPPFSSLFGPPPPPSPPVTPSVEALSRGLTIQAYPPTNSVFIRYYANDLERIRKLIRETLDIPLPQVKISARLESLDRNALENLGVQWGGAASVPVHHYQVVGQGATTTIPPGGGGLIIPPPSGTPFNGSIIGNPFLTLSQLLPVAAATGLPTGGSLINLPVSTLPATGASSNTPTGGLSFGIIGSRFSVNLALQALAELQKTRTIARPEVVTVENNKAIIQLGREIPYQTVSSAGTQVQFRDAVLQLQVTPVVIAEGTTTKVKLNVLVENNEQGADTIAGPTIVKRRAETQVLVKEGEHLVIGGVGTSTDQKTVRKVPVFGDIPVLGWLFKQKGDREQSSELVVFITPSVLRTPPTSRATPPK
jgi:type IV pilus assembly protein PilQ